MKFLIIGDSWGIGEYKIDRQIMTAVPDTGIDYYLQQLNHTATNLSAGSACNFGQLRNARTHLDDICNDYDYIIWFHTEPIRDVPDTIIDDEIDGPKQFPEFAKIKDFDQAMEYINYQNYKFAQSIFDQHKIPFITIGGVGRLSKSIDDFFFSKIKIYSWSQELLNCKLELPVNFFSRVRLEETFEKFNFDQETVIAHLELTRRAQEEFKKSDLFPDNAHVHRSEYKKLATRILTNLESNE
jgi:hypothetical protein